MPSAIGEIGRRSQLRGRFVRADRERVTFKMRFVLRFFGFLFSIGAIFFVIGAVGLGWVWWTYSKDLPDHSQLAGYEPPVMTRVHATDGSLIAEYARERRLYLPVQSIPKRVINAFLS